MNEIWLKYRKVFKNIVYICLTFLSIFVLVKYLIPFFAPFVVGIIIASFNEPFIRFLESRLKFRRKYSVLLAMFFSMLIFGVIFAMSISNIYSEITKFQSNSNDYISLSIDNLNNYIMEANTYYKTLPSSLTDAFGENFQLFSTKIEDFLNDIISGIISTITSLPRLIVFFIISLLSAYFISSDIRRIRLFFFKQFSKDLRNNFDGIKAATFSALFGYSKAIVLLMGITFVEVSLGLLLIRADYAILMGLIVALAEAIPLFGTGMIMIPWIFWHLINGNVQMALGLSIIFILGVIIRQILEPKLVGDRIGVHPLVTLLAMYIGLEIFGMSGLFVGPFSIIILKSMQQSGIITLWRE